MTDNTRYTCTCVGPKRAKSKQSEQNFIPSSPLRCIPLAKLARARSRAKNGQARITEHSKSLIGESD